MTGCCDPREKPAQVGLDCGHAYSLQLQTRVRGFALVSRLPYMRITTYALTITLFNALYLCPATADPLLDFNVDIVWGTLTIQNGSGAVLQTFNNLASSQTLPSDLASLIAADPIAPAYVQYNISQLVGTGETTFDFLDQPPNVFPPVLLSVSGSVDILSGDAFNLATNDLETIALGPITGTTPHPTGEADLNDQYVFPGIGSNPDVAVIVNVNFFSDSVIETVATPEPSLLPLPLIVLVGVGIRRRRQVPKRRMSRRSAFGEIQRRCAFQLRFAHVRRTAFVFARWKLRCCRCRPDSRRATPCGLRANRACADIPSCRIRRGC